MITIEQGRAAYNRTRVGDVVSLEIRKMGSHEADVAAFFKRAEIETPVAFAEVCARYPVLSEDDLKYRRAQELYAFGPMDGDKEPGESDGDFDGVFNPHGAQSAEVPDMVGTASLIRHRESVDNRRLAALRGEPYGGV